MKRLTAAIGATLLCVAAHGQSIIVGSKMFTESYVLGEIAKRVLTEAGFDVSHKQGMGATAIVWGALKTGEISLYPEYTGTISEEILKIPRASRDTMTRELAKFGVGMGPDLGFNDAYGIVMRRQEAKDLNITKISDLRSHPDLKCGITHELMGRKDGWNPLCARYGLKFGDVKEIVHTLGYAALFANQIDIKDCYTTDAEIQKYDLVVLQDDLHFFPLYKAVFLYRLNMPQKAIDAMAKLAGTIDEKKMIAMNAEANLTKSYSEAASLYFKAGSTGNEPRSQGGRTIGQQIREQLIPQLLRHLQLVGVSMLIAVIVGLPLGIWAARPGWVGGFIMGATGMVQTIPSLALLALFVSVPYFGITFNTAVAALFLYSLLPIVRNTATGLAGIPVPLKEAAAVLGLEPIAQLRKVYLPMASPTILAGIKTSAVINVGTATLATLIGQGGLGESIMSGIAINDTPTILWGAIPAALLALIVQLGFDAVERFVVPRGLRLSSTAVEVSD